MSELPDFREMLAQAREMQGKLVQVQRTLAQRRVEGAAGGGMVRAVANGEMRILEVHIEAALFESGDRGMVQDLVAAAVNAALQNAQGMMQEELQRAATSPGGP